MKQSLKYAILFFLPLLFAACENDVEPHQHSAITPDASGFKVKTVTAKQLPQITAFLETGTNGALSGKDTIEGAVFDTHNILEVIDSLSNSSYSFRFAYPDTPEHIFYNLVVGVDADGVMKTPYILKYECDQEHFPAFKDNGYQFRFFSGSVKLHAFSHYFGNGGLSGKTDSDCVQYDPYGDPIPCEQTVVGDGTSDGSGGPATGNPSGGTPSGTGTSDGSATDNGTAGYNITLSCTCMGHGEDVIEAGLCNCNTFVLTINGNAGAMNKSLKSTDCPDCTLPSGSAGINTYPLVVNQLNLSLGGNLSSGQLNWLENNTDTVQELNDFLAEYDYSEDAKNTTLITITSLVNNNLQGPYDVDYYNQINSYTQADLNNPIMNIRWAEYFAAQCAILKAQNPTWSMAKVYWEATKEMLHFALDIMGLFPVVGEVCDIANGLIYTIEGDGINATLSMSSAIPFAGWFSTGTKIAYKGPLKFAIRADGLIDFGKRNSKKFREALGIPKGSDLQAHHIISRASDVTGHPVIQKAAKSKDAFHIDEALNGIPVEAWRNQPNHPDYTNKILQKLQDFNNLSPNATPQECYDFLTDLIDDIKTAIISNPGTHLNDLIF